MKTEKSNLVRTTRFMNNLHHMAFTLLCKATYHQGADIFRANSRGRQRVANCSVFIVQLKMKNGKP